MEISINSIKDPKNRGLPIRLLPLMSMNYSEEFTNGIWPYYVEVEFDRELYKSRMWYSLWAFVFGWKVTKTRDAIRASMEVQSNSKAEI